MSGNNGLYVGIDLGTSAVKVIAADAKGRIIAEASESYGVFYPQNGWSEQNPEDWFSATLKALKRLNVKNVRGISFGGQMHGLVVLDGDGKVIRPCILWNDGRTEKQTAYLNGTVGRDKLAALTGNVAFAGFTAPKLLWLRENEPGNFGRIEKIMLPKDYLVYRFSGAFATDFSDAAGTLLLDVGNRRWSDEMVGICGISAGQLPELCESFTVVGALKSEISEQLGWADVKVIVGAGDNAAAAVGTGTVLNGDCNISLGTSGTLFIATDKFSLPENNALHSFCHANGGWHLMGCILSAASANKWFIEDILGADYDLCEKAAAELGKNDLYFLPYLMGERCPHNDVKARGAFIGLSADTSKEDMALAVMEGVAFALRDCLELAKESGATVSKSTVCGGGAKSKLWLKILANVLNLNIYTVETEQGPAYGAAMLAMTGCGVYESVESAAANIVKKEISVAPERETALAYGQKYLKYRELYPLLKSWFNEMK